MAVAERMLINYLNLSEYGLTERNRRVYAAFYQSVASNGGIYFFLKREKLFGTPISKTKKAKSFRRRFETYMPLMAEAYCKTERLYDFVHMVEDTPAGIVADALEEKWPNHRCLPYLRMFLNKTPVVVTL